MSEKNTIREFGTCSYCGDINTTLYQCKDCNAWTCFFCTFDSDWEDRIKEGMFQCRPCNHEITFEEHYVEKTNNIHGNGTCCYCRVSDTTLYQCEDCGAWTCGACTSDDEWQERLKDGVFLCERCVNAFILRQDKG